MLKRGLKRSLSILLSFSVIISLFVAAPGVSDAESAGGPAMSSTTESTTGGIFGPNVHIFDPSTPAGDIQAIATAVHTQQESNEFGDERFALLFKPGEYNANIRVGFYTHVAGLGQNPADVKINGGVTADAEWWKNPDGSKNATKNFWRAAENLHVKPTLGTNKWAVSQAVPFRRMLIEGDLQLHDGGWASGGFLADSIVTGTVQSGGQQQWFTRNSDMNEWRGGLWNTVFVGVDNANESAVTWPDNSYTIVDEAPIMREKPYLTFDDVDGYQVFVPDLQTDGTKGASWSASDQTPGTLISIDDFHIAQEGISSAASINAALADGKHLLLTPGIYELEDTIKVTNPNTVVLGIGFATLKPVTGKVALSVADVEGAIIAGLLFDAGSISSSSLLEVGTEGTSITYPNNPISLHDLFFRVGGGKVVGKADVSLKINSNNVIGDHFWIWRADHGTDVGWDLNTTKNGLVVNGNDVTIYGLFVEHYHEYQTLWNGERGKMYFYQSEIPYDVPDQESWMSNNGTVNGFASYKVAESVTTHDAWGLGIYSFFRDAPVKLHSSIEIPDAPNVKIHHAASVFLAGKVGSEITHIINDSGDKVTFGGNKTIINGYTPRTPVDITPLAISTIVDKEPVLPLGVTQTYTDLSTKHVPVNWDSVTSSVYYEAVGSFTVEGTGIVDGKTITVEANVTVNAAPAIPVTGITVTGAENATAITTRDGALQMSAAIEPIGAKTDVDWSVVNMYGNATELATISQEGLLTAVKDGVVKVIATATDGTGVKGELVITINNQITKVSGITVTAEGGATSIFTKAGKLQMSATVTPGDADDTTFSWAVSNVGAQQVATIDATGLLTAQRDGVVNVLARANDSSGVVGSLAITISGQNLTLDDGWSWVRESLGNWSIDPFNANVMKLTTIEGRWTADSGPSNIFLRDLDTDGDFSISSKLKFDATVGFEWAGLIVYQDDGNFISLGRQANGNNPNAVKQLRSSTRVNYGGQGDKNFDDLVAPNDIYLKIERNGANYKAFYSSDDVNWTEIPNAFNDITLTNPQIGMFVRKLRTNVDVPAKVAEFSDFTLSVDSTDSIIPIWNPVLHIAVTGVDNATGITTKNGTLQMSAAVSSADESYKKVNWSVVNVDGSATDLATIDANGKLTAIDNGQVKVVAAATDRSGITGSAIINISGQNDIILIPVTSITVTGADNATAITTKNGTLQMSAEVLPQEADDRTVTWSVDNATVATISDGGLLTAKANGTVKVTATANDGSSVVGEMTITISGQQSAGGGNVTPGPKPTPTPNPEPELELETQPIDDHQQLVSEADLNDVQDGKLVVTIDEGKTEVVLPIDVAQAIKHAIEVKSGQVSVIVPPAVLSELIDKLGEHKAGAEIIIRIEADTGGNAVLNNASFSLDGHIYNLDIIAIDKDGNEMKLSTFSEPVHVVLPYEGDVMDEALLGIYVYDEASQQWEYVGGEIDTSNSTITAMAPHFSQYAVLEYNKTFTDVPSSHWANRTLKVLAAKHIVNGVSSTEYNPSGQTTRAEFVALLVRALELNATNVSSQFTDVKASDWYALDVAAAYDAGLVSGVSSDKFAPQELITREQMAILIVRAYEYINGTHPVDQGNLSLFKDKDHVSYWAQEEVNKAVGYGLMKGQAADVFAPLSNATRAETAQAILNMLNQLK